MDVPLQISLLREHSEQLRKLATDLSADLSKLGLALSEQAATADREELSLLVELAELHQSLFLATDTFSHHLQTLFGKGKSGNGLTA